MKEDKFGLDRIVFFSDAIIAIAITLLVIELKVPVVENTHEIGEHLLEMWSEFLGYFVSFMVISLYWLAHHRVFRMIENYDRRLMLLNILFLMFIAFMPFSTGLLFNYPAEFTPVVFYALTVALIGLLLFFIWTYSVKNGLVFSYLNKEEEKKAGYKLLLSPAVFIVSIFVALFSPFLAMLSWILLFPIQIIVSRLK